MEAEAPETLGGKFKGPPSREKKEVVLNSGTTVGQIAGRKRPSDSDDGAREGQSEVKIIYGPRSVRDESLYMGNSFIGQQANLYIEPNMSYQQTRTNTYSSQTLMHSHNSMRSKPNVRNNEFNFEMSSSSNGPHQLKSQSMAGSPRFGNLPKVGPANHYRQSVEESEDLPVQSRYRSRSKERDSGPKIQSKDGQHGNRRQSIEGDSGPKSQSRGDKSGYRSRSKDGHSSFKGHHKGRESGHRRWFKDGPQGYYNPDGKSDIHKRQRDESRLTPRGTDFGTNNQEKTSDGAIAGVQETDPQLKTESPFSLPSVAAAQGGAGVELASSYTRYSRSGLTSHPAHFTIDPSWAQAIPDNQGREASADPVEADGEPMWRNQIRELRTYILKLEEEKKELQEQSRTSCMCSKDNTIFAVIQENMEKVRIVQEKEKARLDKEKERLEEETRSVEKENLRLGEERLKLEKAKTDLKATLDQGMKMLEAQRIRQEAELQAQRIRQEAELQDQRIRQEAELQDKLLAHGGSELVSLRQRVQELERQQEKEKEREKEEEQRHIQSELEELEIRREMTTKALESEARIEELEAKLEISVSQIHELREKLNAAKAEDTVKLSSELGRVKAELAQAKRELREEQRTRFSLQSKLDGDYKVFLEKKSQFDADTRLRCVFCPGEFRVSVSSFLFHVAREHMFDQYKKVDVESETAQVGLLLNILEEKSRKEFIKEINLLKQNLTELNSQAEKFEDIKEEKNKTVERLQEKIRSLEEDIESLLSVKGQKEEEIEGLVTRNNTLQNQVAGAVNSALLESIKLENKDLKSQLSVLTSSLPEAKVKFEAVEAERNVLRQRLNAESGEKMGIKTKLREVLHEKQTLQSLLRDTVQEKETLRKRLADRERSFNEARTTLRAELKCAQEEKTSLKLRLEGIESKVSILKTDKSSLESQLCSLRSENKAIKEFRSDMSAINDVLLEETRAENRNLSSSLKVLSREKQDLQARISSLTSSSEQLARELDSLREERETFKERLAEKEGELELKIRDIQLLQARNLELEQSRLELEQTNLELQCTRLEPDFSNFDLGLDSLLRGPLDDINLQIENIDILNTRKDEPQSSFLHLRSPDIPQLGSDGKVMETTRDIGHKDVHDSKMTGHVSVSEECCEQGVSGSEQQADDIEELSSDSKSGDSDQNYFESDGSHRQGCDCVDCDDMDYLHGFVHGEPYGIKEMMQSLQDGRYRLGLPYLQEDDQVCSEDDIDDLLDDRSDDDDIIITDESIILDD